MDLKCGLPSKVKIKNVWILLLSDPHIYTSINKKSKGLLHHLSVRALCDSVSKTERDEKIQQKKTGRETILIKLQERS